MNETAEPDTRLRELIGEQVILDVKAPVLYIGTLAGFDGQVVVLEEADVHFYSDSQTTIELYLLETRKNGIRPNRSVVYVMRDEVCSVSRLEDVILY
jgi:small nuclear ribonucleoprotein (snRNP)-like protein